MEQITAYHTTPPDIFNIIFSLSAYGGTYSREKMGAYGRLEAWQFMRGLVGVEAETSVASASESAERTTWVYYEASNDRFLHALVWFGMAALRPDGRSLVVLAGSDTD
ncbi:MAG: hypothetical protein HY318_19890 [Armatimonadetes bacterium]|nr:hypothetical protein [Armatimonadota bacterium]